MNGYSNGLELALFQPTLIIFGKTYLCKNPATILPKDDQSSN